MKKNQAKLLAIVGLVFFPFVAIWLLKDEGYELTEDEKKFVNFYVNLGWLILLLLVISIGIYVVGFLYSLDYFLIIGKLIFVLSFGILILGLFNVFKNETLDINLDYSREFITKQESFDFNILVAYIPFLNYYLWSLNKIDKKYEIYFKEGIIWTFVLFLAGLVNTSLFYLILFLLISRAISIFFGVNINMISYFVDKSYLAGKPWGFLAYLEAGFYYVISNLILVISGKKAVGYQAYLKHIEEFYSMCVNIDKILKYPKKYLFLILSYAIFILIVAYYFYVFFVSYLPYSFMFSLLGIAFYFLYSLLNKKICSLPFVSSILFYILKKF